MSFTTHTPLEKGTLERVTEPTIKKLRDAGITTVEALVVTPPRQLVDITGMGIATAQRAIKKARELVDPGFMAAKELAEKARPKPRCTTGSKELDRILGGGIETGTVTELIGEFAGGKTQICMTLSVMAQRPPEEGGFGGGVAVIDTENTFNTTRVTQIARERGYDPDETLEGILVAPAYNANHLSLLIRSLHKIVQENHIRLVICDSLIAHFRSEYIGRANLADRQQLLASCLGDLLRIAAANDVAVGLTNQMQANPSGYFSNPNRPAGGHIMAHAATYRVQLWKGSKNTRLAAVIDSSYLPDEKIRFRITELGVQDVNG